MQIAGLVKRILPFVLTFSVGLLIASFFIPIGLPSFGNWREVRRERHQREDRELRMENESLRDRNRSLEFENEQLRRAVKDSVDTMEMGDTPFELEAPHPPPPPRRPKHPRNDIIQ